MANPYAGMIKMMRSEGAAKNPPDIDIGTVRTVNPLSLFMGGAVIKSDICKLDSVTALAVSDAVAVKRLGRINLILGKVVGV